MHYCGLRISNALLEIIIFFLWAIDHHFKNELPLKPKMHFPYKSSIGQWLLIIVKFKFAFPLNLSNPIDKFSLKYISHQIKQISPS